MYTLRRHLIGTGRREEARTVIAALNGVPEDDGLVYELVGELDFAIRAENEGGKATWLECFSTGNNLWKRTINGMMLQFIQQLNGQNFYCMIMLLGSLLSAHIIFRLLLETPFLKVQGCSQLMCSRSYVLFSNPLTSLSPYVIQVILGAVSVVGTIPALVYVSLIYVCFC